MRATTFLLVTVTICSTIFHNADAAGPKSMEDCTGYVKDLSIHDIFLNGRKLLATQLVRNGTKAGKFVQDMQDNAVGDEKYQCGYTRFWVDGIYMGLPHQYEEIRRSPTGYGVEAGFQDLLADTSKNSVTSLFEAYAELEDTMVLYKFQLAGVADHVWAVLQVPGPEYKVMQSYNMAYSLYAWMTDSIKGLWDSGNIRYWDDVFAALKTFLEGQGGTFHPNGTIEFPPNTPQIIQDWAYFVKDYNQTQIEDNFQIAWDLFGQDMFVNKSTFMDKYVKTAQQLFDGMVPLISTATAWPKSLNDKWIMLFGSPNPLVYPGAPFNFLTGANMGLEQKLEFQARVELIDFSNNNCKRNYEDMKATIPPSSGYLSRSSGIMVILAVYLSSIFA